ncbi:hypothetical protein [Yersinia kristensenii]|uniref:hypothetical protein n=1 Tax=Yersinia kristensenii TaxID=28152 RepID=UPI0011A5FAEA|nr:hypothetical protein [Yersinia kristensenii]
MQAKQAADTLNRLLAMDESAASTLVGHRVICNESLAGDDVPFVVSRDRNGNLSMGVIGFINSLVTSDNGRVAAIYDDAGRLTGFTVVGCKACEPYQFEGYHL